MQRNIRATSNRIYENWKGRIPKCLQTSRDFDRTDKINSDLISSHVCIAVIFFMRFVMMSVVQD